MRRLVAALCALPMLALPAAAAAQDPVAPTIVTETPRDLTSTGSTLVATATPGSSTLRVAFAYSIENSQDVHVTATRDVAAGAGSTEVAIPVTGLKPSTRYEVVALAEDDAWEVSGELRTFRTLAPPPPPIASHPEVSSIRATSAYLSGRVNGRGQATHFHYEYGTTPALGSRTPDEATRTTGWTFGAGQRITDLPPATTIYYQLVATSSAGEGRSEMQSFTTLAQVQAVDLGALPQVVPYGSPLTVTGSAAGIGPLAGRPVALEAQFGAAWAAVATGTIGGDGTWWLRLPSVRAPVPLRAAAGDSPERVTSMVRTPQVRPLARLGIKRSRNRGPLLTVNVEPLVANAVVTLQRRTRSGRWARVARQVVRKAEAKGAVRFRGPASDWRYRAVVSPGAPGWARATTAERAGSLRP